jgi:hypothetical protein
MSRRSRAALAAAGLALIPLLAFPAGSSAAGSGRTSWAELLPPPVAGPGCESIAFVQVLGEFNDWADLTPPMALVGECLWREQLLVPAGCHFMKFRTDFNWDNPPDYGRCEGPETICELPVPADGTPLIGATCEVAGIGTALGEIVFPADGVYEFELDLSAAGPAAPLFSIRYVSPPVPLGSISGTVAFEDDPPVPPSSIVIAFAAGDLDDIEGFGEPGPNGAFVIGDLFEGAYDLLVQADGYEPLLVEGVVVTPPADTSVGVIVLHPECPSPFSFLQVVGDFNGWDENAPPMASVGPCIWTETLTLEAGCYFMKFRTENSWENPPDYGRCGGTEGPCQIQVPVDGSELEGPTCLVTGIGTALGEVWFQLPGEYEFVLDEALGEFRIRFLGGPVSVEPTSWGKVKAQYR